MGLSEILASAEPITDGFRTAIPADWHQGRTSYGGFSSALALACAMRTGGSDLPPLRSAQVSMIAPLTGKVDLRSRLLRRGRNAIWIETEISGDKGLGLAGTFVFMGPVESSVHLNDRPLPDAIIPPEHGIALSDERGTTFVRHHFDVRFALPKPAVKRPEMCWWVRARERDGLDPAIELLLCADGLPPGVMPLLSPTVPVSTMQWQINLLTPAPATHGGWWLLRSAGDYAEQGCSSQRMAIWNRAGEPVAVGMQSIALFG